MSIYEAQLLLTSLQYNQWKGVIFQSNGGPSFF